jgi:hypothetical protein
MNAQPSAEIINHNENVDRAALIALTVLQFLMLLALYSRTEPHPPLAIKLFALGPFLSASIAVCAAACWTGTDNSRSGNILSLAAALLGLISFGPQKWFDPSFPQIWPAVIAAQIACLVLLGSLARRSLARSGLAARQ